MLKRLLPIAVSLAVTPPAEAQTEAFTAAQQTEMVAAHNQWRRAVGAPDIKWSATVASTAQAWAKQLQRDQGCRMAHSATANLGENLYWASALQWSDGKRELQAVAATKVVDAWGSEKHDYHYRTNTCRAGKVCGHYTQMVWNTTTEIGCAMAVCSDKSQVWVCNYAPPGNVVGQKPY